MKNKYITLQQMTTELQAVDFGQAHTECGGFKYDSGGPTIQSDQSICELFSK